MLRWVLKKVEVVLTAREEQRVVLLLRFEIGDLSFTDIMFKGLEVILICLGVLDQVLFDGVIFIFLTIIMTSKERIEGEAIMTTILHAIPVT